MGEETLPLFFFFYDYINYLDSSYNPSYHFHILYEEGKG